MSLEELECHLIELESKNMNTRGVLRRLLMLYCSRGNTVKSNEVVDKLRQMRCQFSPGMSAAVLDLRLKTDSCELAWSVYKELRRTHPDFNIDRYKILKLADLLMKQNRFEGKTVAFTYHVHSYAPRLLFVGLGGRRRGTQLSPINRAEVQIPVSGFFHVPKLNQPSPLNTIMMI
jgi:hypothetical protein